MLHSKRKILAITSACTLFVLFVLYGLFWSFTVYLHQMSLDKGLMKAILANDAARARSLIESGADANARTQFGGTLTLYQNLCEFVTAISQHSPRQKHGSTALMQLSRVPISNQQHSAPTILAPRPANIDIAKDLLRHGANVNAEDESGATALDFAAAYGDLDYCRLLLENGANPNLYAAIDGGPLMNLVQNSWQRGCQQTAVTMLLIKKGAIVNVQNSLRETPLANAIGGGDLEVATALRNHGANPNTTDKNGNTPLMNLIHAGYLYDSAKSPVIKFMLNSGADVNLQNIVGDSPISYGVMAGDVSLLRALLARGANPNIHNNHGISPFGLASGPYNRRFTGTQRTEILDLLKRYHATL